MNRQWPLATHCACAHKMSIRQIQVEVTLYNGSKPIAEAEMSKIEAAIIPNDFRGRKINNRQETSLRQRERGRVMHAGMASGLKRRFDDDDDDLSHFARCLKYRLVMTSMICVTLKMTGLTSMHHAPSFAALTSVVHLPTSKIIVRNHRFSCHFLNNVGGNQN